MVDAIRGSTPGVLKILAARLPRVCRLYILLELRRLQNYAPQRRRILQPHTFIGGKEEQPVFENWSADASGKVAVFLINPARALIRSDCELTRGIIFAADFTRGVSVRP